MAASGGGIKFGVGSRVAVWSESSQAWLDDGQVVKVTHDGSVTVTYHGGATSKELPPSRLHLLKPITEAQQEYQAGDRVAVWSESNQAWFEDGQVESVMQDGSVTVRYHGGALNKELKLSQAHLLRPMAAKDQGVYRVGDRVAVWSQSQQSWIEDGQVAKVKPHSISVTYDNRGSSKDVPMDQLDRLVKRIPDGQGLRQASDSEANDSWWGSRPVVGRPSGPHERFYWESALYEQGGVLATIKERVIAHGGPARQDDAGRLPLHGAAEAANVELTSKLAFALNVPPSATVKQSMKDQQISVDTLDDDGEAPMHLAAQWIAVRGSAEKLEQSDEAKRAIAELLQHGADPFVHTSRGLTPKDIVTNKTVQHRGILSLDSSGNLLVEGQDGLRSEYENMLFGAALLYASRVAFPGSVVERKGGECIASFPGKYSKLWQKLVDTGKSGSLSAAVVFLPYGSETYGKHATTGCLCNKLYGYIPEWGCLWCQHWMDNVRKAQSLGQRLVVLFFEGQLGQGVAKWEELPLREDDKRLGKGLGFSQRGELAFLLHEGYDVEYRDVREFAKSMGAELH